MIYKYRAINKNTLKILSNFELFYANSKNFNDPFDANYSIRFDDSFYQNPLDFYNRLLLNEIEHRDPQMVKKLRETTLIFQQQKNYEAIKRHISEFVMRSFDAEGCFDIGVSCFSKNFDNILMWSHYADEHKGLVIGFDDNIAPFTVARAVDYPENENFPSFSIGEHESRNPKQIIKSLFTKSHQWKYEEEVRLIYPDDPGAYSFPKESIKQIYFGCKTSKSDKKLVIDLLRSHSLEVEVFQGFKDFEKYKVNFETMDWK